MASSYDAALYDAENSTKELVNDVLDVEAQLKFMGTHTSSKVGHCLDYIDACMMISMYVFIDTALHGQNNIKIPRKCVKEMCPRCTFKEK